MISRRNFLNLGVGAGAAAALAACGSEGPGTSGGGSKAGSASYWFLTGQPGEGIRQHAVDRFNQANPDAKITATTFQNDAYKTRIKTAIGAGQAPTIIWGWGGGGLKSYVEAGQVEDLTDWFGQNAAVKDRLFPTAFGPATINGKIYAMPAETVAPIVLYYNKEVFEKNGAKAPETWDDVMNLVTLFNGKGIAPFSLGGQSRWTNMMWMEFLFDRIGGSEVFQAIFEGKANAWSHPAAKEALTKLRQLIDADGFVKGYATITADSNADQALLYRGRAAMMLHGAWTYGSMSNDGGDFVKSGKLGYMNFPVVTGGKGDPSSTVGNPGQYYSISSKATAEQKETAKKFFKDTVLNDAEVKEWIDSGNIPIVKGTESSFASSKDADFLKFIYDTSANAKNFAQSWDQALSPTAAEALLDNIAKFFQKSGGISPDQFITNMNGVIGK
ncbi:extracellular solute-binding protein [Pseudosporangium ferrugineum]|uniref:Carbohydrate ABC transporter substrate-binding protein (CUT1 family) n=1 Tax=Pseudosporangium ferrugineum TaxID=439699 RepID=A0A2T0SIJ8_9ACTN|nr:extracellular solute-binding protein [Pseudosporangium ferrugineum]PRY33248.1 carbohydrate ABC transporter substrate-binding protein (CUT1 family) [Pseudosporangium ferrugineum]